MIPHKKQVERKLKQLTRHQKIQLKIVLDMFKTIE